MTITELKIYIIKNSKIEYILEQIGCHHIEYHQKGYYTCANKDGDNKAAIVIYNDENLKYINYTRKMKDNNYSNLITLVEFNMNLSFPKAVKYLHNILGLKYEYNNIKSNVEKIDPLHIFKKVKRKRHVINIDDIELFDESILKEYIPLPHIDWIRNDGILPFTCEKFGIGYIADKKKITIPWRWWCGSKKDIVGVIGRTVIPNYDILDIPKYFPLKSFPKSINLYGLQENYESIQKENQVIIYEAEKSVLKRHSRKDETGVAIGSHNIAEEQVRILIGLNVIIIFAYDKDVDLQHIRSECEKFYKIREIYYIYDKYNLLKEKESPADADNKIFNYLLKYKTNYDEKEHREYIKERDKNNEKRI